MLKKIKNRIYKIRFYMIWDGEKRANYLKKKNILKGIGNNCMFQSRVFPMDPKLLKIHDNVTIAANVTFCTHDAIRHVLMYKYKRRFPIYTGCIEIMDNVFIGIGSIIMPDVKIGKNCIVAAGSIVTKDVPDNSIVAGIPAKVIGSFEDLVKKREKSEYNESNDKISLNEIEKNWKYFYKKRMSKNEFC